MYINTISPRQQALLRAKFCIFVAVILCIWSVATKLNLQDLKPVESTVDSARVDVIVNMNRRGSLSPDILGHRVLVNTVYNVKNRDYKETDFLYKNFYLGDLDQAGLLINTELEAKKAAPLAIGKKIQIFYSQKSPDKVACSEWMNVSETTVNCVAAASIAVLSLAWLLFMQAKKEQE